MTEVLKKSRKPNFSLEEIDVLVQSVGLNYDTLYGTFSKRAVNKQARHRAWQEVTKRVNRVGHEKRTLQEVKNKWKKCQNLYKFDNSSASEIPDEFDSMPLEMRLKAPTPSTSTSSATEQDSDILSSHALSPTKLKVTRQSTKPPQISPKPPTPPPPAIVEDVCLRWRGHHTNIQNSFPNLLIKEQFVDATLVAEGQSLKCHRVILSSCSPYFEDILSEISPFQHPVLFMKDVPFWTLKSLCDFMYSGEVKIAPDKLTEYLGVARSLKVKGIDDELAEKEMPKIDMEAAIVKTEEDTSDKNKEVKERSRDGRESRERTREFRERSRELRDNKKYYQHPTETPILKSTTRAPRAPSVQQPNTERPMTLKSTRVANNRTTYTSRRMERRFEKTEKKIEVSNKPPDASNIHDPLGLLQPVYEEPTQKPVNAPIKIKEVKQLPMKKGMPKKIKKRKISDDREESPPPVLSRKGTRSRPNRKIPKFYHPTYQRRSGGVFQIEETTIVREPHTDMIEFEDIKSEPLDLIDDNLDIEDSIVEYDTQDTTDNLMDGYNKSSIELSEQQVRQVATIKMSEPPDILGPSKDSESHKMDDVIEQLDNNVSISDDPLNLSPNNSGASIPTEMDKEDSLGICTDMGFLISEIVSQADIDKHDDLGNTSKEGLEAVGITNVDCTVVGAEGVSQANVGKNDDLDDTMKENLKVVEITNVDGADDGMQKIDDDDHGDCAGAIDVVQKINDDSVLSVQIANEEQAEVPAKRICVRKDLVNDSNITIINNADVDIKVSELSINDGTTDAECVEEVANLEGEEFEAAETSEEKENSFQPAIQQEDDDKAEGFAKSETALPFDVSTSMNMEITDPVITDAINQKVTGSSSGTSDSYVSCAEDIVLHQTASVEYYGDETAENVNGGNTDHVESFDESLPKSPHDGNDTNRVDDQDIETSEYTDNKVAQDDTKECDNLKLMKSLESTCLHEDFIPLPGSKSEETTEVRLYPDEENVTKTDDNTEDYEDLETHEQCDSLISRLDEEMMYSEDNGRSIIEDQPDNDIACDQNETNSENVALNCADELELRKSSTNTDTVNIIPVSERMWSGIITEADTSTDDNNMYNFDDTGNGITETHITNTQSNKIDDMQEDNFVPDIIKESEVDEDDTDNVGSSLIGTRENDDTVQVFEPMESTNSNIDDSSRYSNNDLLFFNGSNIPSPTTTTPSTTSTDLLIAPPPPPQNLVDYPDSSIMPGFHIAQVVSEQIEEHRLSRHLENEQTSLQPDLMQNDLESIVNDLTMIVGDTTRNNDDDDNVVERSCDSTNVVVADSLEIDNLLDK